MSVNNMSDNFDFDIWYKTYDPNFIDICSKSRVPYKWVNYERVLSGPYGESIIKPINKYVEALYPKPDLISLENGLATIRQKTHAEIYLLNNGNVFKNLDRPHIRQYYNTKQSFATNHNCFSGFYKFYIPWFIDANIDVKIVQSPDSPFEILEGNHTFHKVDSVTKFVDPGFVLFAFKKEGDHIIKDGFGKIKIASPMFDIVFSVDKKIEQELRKLYEDN